MAKVTLDPRLAALLPVIHEWEALRSYLRSLSNSEDGQPVYGQAIKWIDDAVMRVTPHLHSRRWPPVWWRLGLVDFDLVQRNFHRADAEGYFRASDGFVPEREKILEWVDRICKMHQTASE